VANYGRKHPVISHIYVDSALKKSLIHPSGSLSHIYSSNALPTQISCTSSVV
jgi:hypothetical protein